jgi:hypothetical protein
MTLYKRLFGNTARAAREIFITNLQYSKHFSKEKKVRLLHKTTAADGGGGGSFHSRIVLVQAVKQFTRVTDIIPIAYLDKIPSKGGQKSLHDFAWLEKIPLPTCTQSPCFIGFKCIIILHKN